MKEIVKVLLAEGIDEETIHEVLDVIQELHDDTKVNLVKRRLDNFKTEGKKAREFKPDPSKSSSENQLAQLNQLSKGVIARKKYIRSANLASKGKTTGIKDPAKRKEVADYITNTDFS